MYAVGINTGTLITKNKTEMDKNVHKVAQGLRRTHSPHVLNARP